MRKRAGRVFAVRYFQTKDGFFAAMKNNRNIRLMYAIALLQGMVFYGPIATLYRQAAGVSVFQITLIESISLALALALEVPWGILADRIGYRRSMILCCGLYFVSKIVFWQADSFGGFLAERLMLSVVCAGLSGLDVSILYLSCPEEESHRVFGIYNNLGMAGLLAASAVYAVFVGENYRLAGLLTVFSYGAAALLALFLREVRSSQPRPAGRQLAEFKVLLGQLVRNPRLLFLVLGAAFLNEAHQTITTFLNQVQYTRAGLSASVIAVIYVVMTLLGLCGGFSARLTGWLGEKRTGAVLLALAAVACLTLTLTCGPVLSVAAILLLRVCHSLFTPLQTTLQNRQVRTADRATALSLNALLMDLVAVFTNLVFGRAADFALSLAMGFGFALCATGLVLYLYSQRGSQRAD